MLQPTDCKCYPLKLPLLPPPHNLTAASSTPALNGSEDEPLDECLRRKLMLELRTGAAVTLTRSNVYVHGGLTIPLNLHQVNSLNIQKELILYFARRKNNGITFQNLDQWISSETFFLDLVSRSWTRLETTVDRDMEQPLDGQGQEESGVAAADLDNTDSKSTSELTKDKPLVVCDLSERLFHAMCYVDHSLFIFGGLVVSPQNGYELVATNELWKLDLLTNKWTLLSRNPSIARRFNHTVHVKNELRDTRDTKLIIVGGLNNLNEPINTIDIYNVTQNCWQFEVTPPDPMNLSANIDGNTVSLARERNFSILVEDNKARIPALAFYTPNSQDTRSRGGSTSHSKEDISDDSQIGASKADDRIVSPITALPLVSNSQGIRMAYTSLQHKEFLLEPFNLKSPTGDTFGYNIIMGGFHPDRNTLNFCCFIFDIPSGKWTRVDINCPESQLEIHRFWRVFVWKSHHRALLLGTKKDDGYLPSVQKFDYIETFSLAMLNAFNKTVHPLYEVNALSNQTAMSNSLLHNNLDEIFKESATREREEEHLKAKEDFTSAATSQFEKYIRYIAPPMEVSTIRSVFPPYAMVLGKDALEIFGNSLSDFEFITSEGESVGVPLYLLRKRWGRYFDHLLSRGYSDAVTEYEASGKRSQLINLSPIRSRLSSKDLSRRGSRWSSAGSLPNFFNRYSTGNLANPSQNSGGQDGEGNSNSNSNSTPPASTPLTQFSRTNSNVATGLTKPTASKTKMSNVTFNSNYDDEGVPPHSSVATTNPSKSRKGSVVSGLNAVELKRSVTTGSTTSSSGGMVFRVPFQEKTSSPSPDKLDRAIAPHTTQTEKRRSSLLGLPSEMFNNGNSAIGKPENARRSSHPTMPSIKQNESFVPAHSNLRYPTSARSSISYVSSSSDRTGNSGINHSNSAGNSRKNSLIGVEPTFPGILNVRIPPLQQAPEESIPVPPQSTRSIISFNEFSLSNRNSPLSSRKPSYSSTGSFSDTQLPPEPVHNSLDKEILDDSYEMASALNYNQLKGHDHTNKYPAFPFPTPERPRLPSVPSSQSTSRTHRPPPGASNSCAATGEKSRLSITSNTDSAGSFPYCDMNDLEPLMIPRTLYMPWPTLSVRAFAEFFYTGQVNGKWLLAPVILDLLVMGKIYEIPLLYSLISEVLYSLVGRKEESLYVICNSLKQTLKQKACIVFNGEEALVNDYLSKNKQYLDLERIKSSLEAIDDGFLELNLLERYSRNYSVSTRGFSDGGEQYEKESAKNDSFSSFSNAFPVVYSPRASFASVGSIGFPPNLNLDQKRPSSTFSPRSKKKSSLSKEIDPQTLKFGFDDLSIDTKHKIQFRKPGPIKSDKQITNEREMALIDSSMEGNLMENSDSETSSSSNSGTPGSAKSGNYPTMGRETSNSEPDSKIYHEDNTSNGEKGRSSSKSSSTHDKTRDDGSTSNLDAGLGLLSLKKMRSKVKKGEDYFEESVDPLLKINSTLQAPGKFQGNFANRSATIGTAPPVSAGKVHRDTLLNKEFNALVLENMISPNALPPVDYVIKSIYRTVVLVNDSKLMIRCLDCIELSKDLKSNKKESR
ncbi:Mds3p KNAG_0G01390 [Huiozyma naganishii CBS 8797]|uniref:Attractin/MKLN-like beta-propeller domain-containing protein n=1 Tax=Huiozyma naganishii (strain ATCC MYA-139 / BCRC 22969 / CBS 8797 / KCTC 17520 / NBRC 10181 / NCYC 3082 / Yp74L-3) TaxID=1071383 RepID=J7S0W9_HUIN7|nr:hypothetical protein KNAG_0G01390 [Kazachstania naganishii CBS 8797]CCK71197.1 hypothetical protein KNAG_0G01390 [Kazachstania naganishii CBS 8797]